MSPFTESAVYARCRQLFEQYYPEFRDAGHRYRHTVASWLSPEQSLLDLGCGRTSLAADEIACASWSAGVDLVLSDLRANIAVSSPVAADAADLPFASSCFDVVTSQWAVEHLVRPQRVFCEVARVLRPGGTFIVFTTSDRNYIPILARVMPRAARGRLIQGILQRPRHESHQTYYRANSHRAVTRLAKRAGLLVGQVQFVGNPFYLAFSVPLFRFALVYEQFTDCSALRAWKLYMLVTLHKPARPLLRTR